MNGSPWALRAINNTRVIVCLIFFSCLFLSTRGLETTGFEHRNDEYLYLKSSQEMVNRGDFLTPTYFGEYRFEKPILYYWFILSSYKIFGVNWFAARFISTLMGSLMICITWLIGYQLFNKRIASLSAVILMTMPLFFAHARTAVPDLPYTFFIVLAFYFLLRFMKAIHEDRPAAKRLFSIFFFVSCSLGFMIKGYPAVIIPIGSFIMYALLTKRAKLLSEIGFGRGILIILLVILPWFLFMTIKHGDNFLHHIFSMELRERVLGADGIGIFGRYGPAIIWRNFVFYLNVIWSNFAPWSLFFFASIPLILKRIKQKSPLTDSLLFLFVWVFFGIFFFIVIVSGHYNIQYMMVVTTPAALLTGFFLLEVFNDKIKFAKFLVFFRKYLPLIIFSVAFFVYTYFIMFFADNYRAMIGIGLFVAYFVIVRVVHQSKSLLSAPLVLGLFMIFVQAQMPFFEHIRASRFSTLKILAETIIEETQEDFVIGIDESIDPTKFRIYFDQKIKQGRLEELFQEKRQTYVILTETQINNNEDDAEYFHKIMESIDHSSDKPAYEIIQQETIIRKKMNIDRGFFVGLLTLDRQRVDHYLREKIILVRKNKLSELD